MDHQFNTSQNSQPVIRFALLFRLISVPLCIYVFLVTIFSLITRQANLGNAFVALAVSSYGLFLAITLPLNLINQYNRVRVAKNGLYVEIYVFRYIWKFVDWKDVLELKLLPLPDRWGKPQWLIKVRELTYWHKLISQHYRCGPQPGIVISSDLMERDKLLDIVEKKLTKNRSGS